MSHSQTRKFDCSSLPPIQLDLLVWNVSKPLFDIQSLLLSNKRHSLDQLLSFQHGPLILPVCIQNIWQLKSEEFYLWVIKKTKECSIALVYLFEVLFSASVEPDGKGPRLWKQLPNWKTFQGKHSDQILESITGHAYHCSTWHHSF